MCQPYVTLFGWMRHSCGPYDWRPILWSHSTKREYGLRSGCVLLIKVTCSYLGIPLISYCIEFSVNLTPFDMTTNFAIHFEFRWRKTSWWKHLLVVIYCTGSHFLFCLDVLPVFCNMWHSLFCQIWIKIITCDLRLHLKLRQFLILPKIIL